MIIHDFTIFLAIEHTCQGDGYKEIESQHPHKDGNEPAGKHNCLTSLNNTESDKPTSSDVQNKSLEITINGEKSQVSNSETVEFSQEKLMR